MIPFRYIFATDQVEGAVFEWSALVAILFYAIFPWIIVKLITIMFSAEVANE